MEQKCHMLDAVRMRIVLLVTSLSGHEPPNKSYDATCTREGHTTVRKYCQPTSTLLTRMCWAREALIIYFSAEHIFSRNAEKCNYQECEVLHRRPPVIGGGDDSK